jgi:hypothetical protein
MRPLASCLLAREVRGTPEHERAGSLKKANHRLAACSNGKNQRYSVQANTSR